MQNRNNIFDDTFAIFEQIEEIKLRTCGIYIKLTELIYTLGSLCTILIFCKEQVTA